MCNREKCAHEKSTAWWIFANGTCSCSKHARLEAECHHTLETAHIPLQIIIPLPEEYLLSWSIILQILPVLDLCIKGLIEYQLFYARLISLNIILMRFIQIVCSFGSFPFLAVWYSVLWKYCNLFIHFLLMDIWIVFPSGFMHCKTNIFLFVGCT